MTMSGAVWGLDLIGITPVAKLVAFKLGDIGDGDGVGTIEVSRLAEWCCAPVEEVFVALVLLAERHGIEWASRPDASIEFTLPVAARQIVHKAAPRGMLPTTIYIFRGRVGIKIGITGQRVEARLKGVRLATLDDSISVEWSFEDRESIIRLSERLAHAKLAAKLIRNEWFDVSLEDAIAAVVAAIQEARKAQK